MLSKIASLVNTGVIQFLNLVGLANRDYPLHDYHMFVDGEEPTHHIVGTGNMANAGDQKKLFTSKSTLLYATADCTIRLNNSNNVAIAILAGVWYEFYQNVHTLFVDVIGINGYLYAYFEGTKPEECRLGA